MSSKEPRSAGSHPRRLVCPVCSGSSKTQPAGRSLSFLFCRISLLRRPLPRFVRAHITAAAHPVCMRRRTHQRWCFQCVQPLRAAHFQAVGCQTGLFVAGSTILGLPSNRLDAAPVDVARVRGGWMVLTRSNAAAWATTSQVHQIYGCIGCGRRHFTREGSPSTISPCSLNNISCPWQGMFKKASRPHLLMRCGL